MEKPKLTEEHRKLERLTGKWAGDEKLSPGYPVQGKARGTWNGRLELDGLFAVADYVEEIDGKVWLRGHAVFGWDAKERHYTMHWFDNFGSPPSRPGIGRWEGDKLTFEHDLPGHNGRTSYEFGGGALTFRVEMDMRDGKGFQPFVEGSYRKA